MGKNSIEIICTKKGDGEKKGRLTQRRMFSLAKGRVLRVKYVPFSEYRVSAHTQKLPEASRSFQKLLSVGFHLWISGRG